MEILILQGEGEFIFQMSRGGWFEDAGAAVWTQERRVCWGQGSPNTSWLKETQGITGEVFAGNRIHGYAPLFGPGMGF